MSPYFPHSGFELHALTAFGERPPPALLWRYRRWIAVLAFLALAAPPLIGVVHPDDPATIYKEGRKPAPPPSPHTFTDWMWFPVSVDSYLRDHFGLRQAMIDLYRYLTNFGFTRPAVLIGHNGRMFYIGDEAVRQSAGLVLRKAKVAEAADLVASMRRLWPSAASPFWWRSRRIRRRFTRKTSRGGRKTSDDQRNTISCSKSYANVV